MALSSASEETLVGEAIDVAGKSVALAHNQVSRVACSERHDDGLKVVRCLAHGWAARKGTSRVLQIFWLLDEV